MFHISINFVHYQIYPKAIANKFPGTLHKFKKYQAPFRIKPHRDRTLHLTYGKS